MKWTYQRSWREVHHAAAVRGDREAEGVLLRPPRAAFFIRCKVLGVGMKKREALDVLAFCGILIGVVFGTLLAIHFFYEVFLKG